jgi:hypothetical protein
MEQARTLLRLSLGKTALASMASDA